MSANETTTLTCSHTGSAVDSNGSSVAPIYAWYKGLAFIAGQTTNTLTGSSFDRGDVIACRVALGNPDVVSEFIASSANLTIQNAPPSGPVSVAISGVDTTLTGTLTCNSTGGSDPDNGDTASLVRSYVWKKGGTPIAGQITSTLVISGHGVAGDAITCESALSDSNVTGASTSSPILIVANTGPGLACSWDGTPAPGWSVGTAGEAISTHLDCVATDIDAPSQSLTYSVSTSRFSTGGACTGVGINSNTGVISGNVPAYGCTLRVGASDGTATATFEYTLSSTANPWPKIRGRVTGIAQHPDGDVIAVGDFDQVGGELVSGFAVIKADGTLDTRFKNFTGAVRDVYAFTATGKILVVGSMFKYGTETVHGAVLLNTDGTIDTTFGANVGTGPSYYSIEAVAVDRTHGKAYLAGNFDVWNGQPYTGIVALTIGADGTHASRGSVVSSFLVGSDYLDGSGTIQNLSGSAQHRAPGFDPTTIAVDEVNERIYAGTRGNNFSFQRTDNGSETFQTSVKHLVGFDSQGRLDLRFKVNHGPSQNPSALLYLGTKLYLGCNDNCNYADGGVNDIVGTDLVAVDGTTGDVDVAFKSAIGQSGVMSVTGLRPGPGGDILVFGGFAGVLGDSDRGGFARITTAGALVSGTAHVNADDAQDAMDGFIDSTGQLTVVGNIVGWNNVTGAGKLTGGIVRVTSAGDVNAGFDVGAGFRNERTSNRVPDVTRVVELDTTTHSLVVAGSFRAFRNMETHRHIVKFNPLTGAPDAAFSANAHSDVWIATIHGVTVDSAISKIYFYGDFSDFSGDGKADGIVRTNLAGVMDASFHPDDPVQGNHADPSNDAYFNVYALALASGHPTDTSVAGNVFAIVSSAAGDFQLRRFLADGTSAPGFATHLFDVGYIGAFDNGLSLDYDPSTGRLVVAGKFTHMDGSTPADEVPSVLAFDGATGVRQSGFATVANPGFGGYVRSLVRDGSSYFVGGMWDSYDSIQTTGLARLTPTGAMANGFNPGTDPNFDVFALLRTSIGQTQALLVGHAYNWFQNANVSNLLALDPNTATMISESVFKAPGVKGPVRRMIPVTLGGRSYFAVMGDMYEYAGVPVEGFVLITASGALAN